MKPLKLEVFPLDQSFPSGYKLPRDGRMTFAAANRAAKAKRLTGTELAAESYRQMTRAMKESGWAEIGCDMFIPGDAATYGPMRVECSRLATLHRFATLPSHDQEDDDV